jgi:GAF domain-containing protein
MSRRDKPGAKAVRRQRPRAPSDTAKQRKPVGRAPSAELARVTRERDEALEQQAATAEILKLISRSGFDLQAVLNTLTATAARLCSADMGAIALKREGGFYHATNYNFPVDWVKLVETYRLGPGRESLIGRTLLARAPVQIADVLADPEYGYPDLRDAAGYRSLLGVPMMRDGEAIGILFLGRNTVLRYSDVQVKLVTTFADQAVIAIENARLFVEAKAHAEDLSISLQQQTATSEVLKLISRSAFDLQTVLDTLVESATRLCEASDTIIFMRHGDALRTKAHFGPIPVDFAEQAVSRGWVSGRAVLERQPIQVLDPLESANSFPEAKEMAARLGFRTTLSVPLLLGDEAIGAITIRRTEVEAFSDSQIELIKTFADQAVIAIENVRLISETREALRHQTATGEILASISASLQDAKPVFDTIVRNLLQLFGTNFAVVQVLKGDIVYMPAADGHPGFERLVDRYPRSLDDATAGNIAMREKRVVTWAPVRGNPDAPAFTQEFARDFGFDAVIFAPMLRGDTVVGAIGVARAKPEPFGDKQVALIQSFADQAVIAIENTRLFNETKEALEQQTATADVLKVIANSPANVQPVFDAIVQAGLSLFPSSAVILGLESEGTVKAAAIADNDAGLAEMLRRAFPVPLERDYLHAAAILERRYIDIPDAEVAPPEFLAGCQTLLSTGHRAITIMPMVRGDQYIGVLSVVRREPGSLSDRQQELLKTFADQAVIAIENTRLLRELRERTQDLSESLEQQTATSEVLSAISRSAFDLNKVLQTLVESAAKLSDSDSSTITRQDGGKFYRSEAYGFSQEFLEVVRKIPVEPDRGSVAGRALLDGQVAHVPDVLNDPEYTFTKIVGLDQFRTTLGIPMMRDGAAIGVLTLTRKEARPYTQKQIDIVTTFADQAAIAIENSRLFEEVKARTRELTESLVHQKGSADILSVIASSPTDVAPVLNAIVDSACQVCEAYDAVVALKDGDYLRFSAHKGPIPLAFERWPINRRWTAGRAFLDKKPVQVEDLSAESNAEFSDGRELSLSMGHRTTLSVPLLRDGESIGAIALRRNEVNPFSEKQVALLQTFADQAVIAIGNVQLFEQVQARTRELSELLEQQVATSDVLQVISSSLGELDPVFQSMLANATRLCEAECGVMWLREDNGFRSVAIHGPLPPAYIEQWRSGTPAHAGRHSPLTVLARTRKAVHVPDMREDPSYLDGDPLPVAAVEVAGIRTLLLVPMSKEDQLVGGISIYRQEVRPFTDKQVDLVSTFAKQAVIAIENARLLKELRQRTDDLSRSLDELRTAQDRLVQTEKLASLGQLTAGIAHEIKNPLNFENNFASLSTELIDEVNEVLSSAGLGPEQRRELNELTRTLRGNLEKVVQHGKRADSIVKNMLLHSREGSGELRPVDINALLDEGLNLAYHGARAEKPHFNINLQRKLDPDAGQAEIVPQDVTRVLLNVISNGFYAATRRAKDAGDGFVPTLYAETRNLGDRVEVRIRDNGTGMPADVKAKIFTPFFTTKPPGEGTGLGLSMSHDIIVKQHGGSIDVETEPGCFTEFVITLPRRAADKKKTGGQG